MVFCLFLVALLHFGQTIDSCHMQHHKFILFTPSARLSERGLLFGCLLLKAKYVVLTTMEKAFAKARSVAPFRANALGVRQRPTQRLRNLLALLSPQAKTVPFVDKAKVEFLGRKLQEL